MKIKKCIGCGYCCMKSPCEASLRLYGSIKECPQLIWNEQTNRYNCNLMLLPGLIGQGYREELFAGTGCCSSLNSWRLDVKKRTGIELSTHCNPLPKLLQQFIKCLAAQFVSGDVISLTISSLINMLKNDGYSKKEIHVIVSNIINIFQDNQQSITKDFMG